MDAQEYEQSKAKLAAWNARDKEYQAKLKALAEDIKTVESTRRNNKAQYGELLARVQAHEKSLTQPKREPHPDKPGVEVLVREVQVPVAVPVESPLSWGRALKKVCGLG